MAERWIIDLVRGMLTYEENGHDPAVACRRVEGCQSQRSESLRAQCLHDLLKLVPDDVKRQAEAITDYLGQVSRETGS